METAFDELLREFTGLGIKTLSPGFYDHPLFIAAEDKDPRILDRYAMFVQKREYDQAYVSGADRIVREAVEFLYSLLQRDGRLGACLDVSMVLSRMMERAGIWNYIVQGACAVTKKKTGKTVLFTPFSIPNTDEKTALTTAHAWVVAPPYLIVDVTIGLQPVQPEEKVDGFVCVRNARKSSPKIKEVVYQDYSRLYEQHFGVKLTLPILQQSAKRFCRNMDQFGVWLVETPEAYLKYSSCHITAPNEPPEEAHNLKLDGMEPLALADRFLGQLNILSDV